MVNGVFTIPLDLDRPLPRSESAPDEWLLGDYIGDAENQLVKTATESLLGGCVRYSPYVFCGPMGVGKSLLSRGLVARWQSAHPRQSILVTTGAAFARNVTQAIDTDTVEAFRQRAREAALLLIDDLAPIVGKRSAQQELLGTLDALQVRQGLVVVTCRVAPIEMDGLLPTLASRLSGGLTVAMVPPGTAAKRLLLARLSYRRGLTLGDQELDSLLANDQPNSLALQTVPQLDGFLTQLQAAAGQTTRRLDAALIARTLREGTAPTRRSLATIATHVSRYFQIPVSELRGPTRRQVVVRARGVAMLLARRLTSLSQQQLGRYFQRDHTTVMHACRTTELLAASDPRIRRALDDIFTQLQECSKEIPRHPGKTCRTPVEER